MDFEIPVFGQDADSFEDYEYLFWVGCAGAYEDRAKKTTKAVAELLATAGVKFMVLGADETCTGDSARRAGNEFLFQQLAMQNIELLNSVFDGVEQRKRKIVVTCAHCFNALGNEYPEVGGDYEVVHHTQLLNRLVRQKKLIPVASVGEDVTYHDPCFLGRHNKVYDAPRELMEASGAKLKEMPRHGERSMCCGAGGARMWMEENIGKRINIDRVDEALSTDPKKIATGCPFCRVMLTDGVTARQESGQGEGVEVVDVAQLMLSSITRLEPEKLSENIKVIPREKPAEPAGSPAAAEATAEVIEKERVEEVEEAAATPAATEAPAGKGLAMKGLAKAPGAKAPGAKAPGKGLGMAGGAKAPGKGPAGRRSEGSRRQEGRSRSSRGCRYGGARSGGTQAQGSGTRRRCEGTGRQGSADEGCRQGSRREGRRSGCRRTGGRGSRSGNPCSGCPRGEAEGTRTRVRRQGTGQGSADEGQGEGSRREGRSRGRSRRAGSRRTPGCRTAGRRHLLGFGGPRSRGAEGSPGGEGRWTRFQERRQGSRSPKGRGPQGRSSEGRLQAPKAEAPAAEAPKAEATETAAPKVEESNGDGSNGKAPETVKAPPPAKPGGLGFKAGAKAPGRKS